jgi:ABC-type multidrug transport system fused ATPase/permease subunit
VDPYAAIRQSQKGIILAISLVVVEYVAWIIEPTLFGDVIDAFIDKAIPFTAAGFIVPLSAWIGVFLLNSGVGAFRRSFEPKLYMPLLSRMAVDVSKRGFDKGDSVSRTAGRAELMREYISFFQYRVPEFIDQAISIGGAIIALAFYDYRIALACLVVVFPLGVVTSRYATKIEAMQQSLHDIREKAYDVFSTKDVHSIEEYYAHMAESEKRIAHWGGLNFGIVRLFLLGIFLVVLYISIDIDDFTTGNIYSIVAYLWTFVTSAEYVPELLESVTSLKELNQRLRLDELGQGTI